MKKQLIIMLLFLLPFNVKAEENLVLSCPEKASPNQNVECSLTTNNIRLKGLKLNINLTENITYKETTVASNWKTYYQSYKGLLLTNPNNVDNLLSTITFNISEDALPGEKATIKIINIEASNENHELINISDITKEISILSDDNTLSSLTISNGKLSPTFNKNTYSYTATTTKDTTTITAKTNNNNATLSGDIGEKKLNYGTNNFSIVVTSELGTKRTYNLIIIREKEQTPAKESNSTSKKKNSSSNYSKSKTKTNESSTTALGSDASLKEIIIEGYDINFNKDKFLYKLKVTNDVTSLKITATPTDKDAKVEIDNPETLLEGKNTITITVTAKDNTICKYTIIVDRKKEVLITQEQDTKSIDKNNIKEDIPISNLLFKYFPYILIFVILLISAIIIKKISKSSKEN